MKCFVLENIPFGIDVEKLMKMLHVDGDDESGQDVRALVGEALAIGKPKGVYKESFIDEKGDDWVTVDGTKFRSRVLRVNVEKVYRVFPYVATCGAELEEWSSSIDDMLKRYWADTIKEMALRSAMEVLKTHLLDHFKPGHIATMNPGSLEDWPINEQKKLFSIIGDTKSSVGVEVTDSYLMIPTKSVSGIWFPTEVDFESCQLCPREGCPGRRADYDHELYEKKYGK